MFLYDDVNLQCSYKIQMANISLHIAHYHNVTVLLVLAILFLIGNIACN